MNSPAAPSPHPSLADLASGFGMRTMTDDEMMAIEPDFSLGKMADWQASGCFVGVYLRPRDASDAGSRSDSAVGDYALVTHPAAPIESQQWVEVALERIRPTNLTRILVSKESFELRLRAAERGVRALDGLVMEAANDEAESSGQSLQLSLASIEASASPVVRLVDSTLYDALKLGASDIHFEVGGQGLQIKVRCDGVLQPFKSVDGLTAAQQVISRIKVLSDLDISEHRIPQDGRFRARLEERDIDFRVSIMPNLVGEDAVLRILDRRQLTGQQQALTLDVLRFEPHVKSFIRHSAHLPYGLLLVTGPTGSGKTTTLYAAITEINSGLDKIVTIEDPIEYRLEGVLQIPVNEKKGLTFATGLRSILRHDPDKIMVGEIRDSETAMIAVQAALTGHQVFTTVHANNVFDVIGRFSNMGVDTYSLVAALTGIMAQRLLRVVCPHCATDSTASPEELGLVATVPMEIHGPLKIAQGCSHCRGTGYKGRIAIAETLPLDDDMKDLLIQRATTSSLKRAARDKGFRGLRDSAISLALQGLTTAEEVNRMTPLQ